MSIRLPTTAFISESNNETEEVGSTSSEGEDDDQNWDDWASDSGLPACESLFEPKKLPSVAEALAYDKSTHGFDLNAFCAQSSLGIHGRIRLINWIRKEKPASKDVLALKGTESLFTSDSYLLPTIEDDPLLQIPSDDWSDSDNENGPIEGSSSDAKLQIQKLRKQLEKETRDFANYRDFVQQQLNLSSIKEALADPSPSNVSNHRDDDSQYFRSYGENDIHALMIQDKVRTSTYAAFILTNPSLFRDAVVLDVGCGTGILSLFAARGGAKRVIAVDASEIADKAQQIVKANGLENVITVIRGKIEEITLPDDVKHVDIILSEWMGYALLYESMLDSVLCSRDRFLNRETGIMAPSQCRMMLALCDANEILKERVLFWNDVYGFDMSAIADDVYVDAIVDVVGPDSMVSDPHVIKDLHLRDIQARQLEFSSSFSLTSTAHRRTKVRAFVLYFDTFFTVTGEPVPPETEVQVTKETDVTLVEVWPVGGKPPPQRRQSLGKGKDKITSFSTGPRSTPTHWKQTLFLLRDPIVVCEGTVVSGTFHCRKSETNSRELDVEIHYVVKQSADAAPGEETVIQMFKVR